MFSPIDFGYIEMALATPLGWAELGLVVVCLAIAWLVDRRVAGLHLEDATPHRLQASFVRVVFPLTALLLVFVTSIAYHRYVGSPFFLSIATPMLIALAAIRMIVYGLRRLFPSQRWLPTFERAIAFTVWGLVVLHFLGLLPEIASALDEVQIPIGKGHVSLLSVLTALLVVVFTLIVTLWLSGILEQRLGKASQLDVNLRVVLAKFVRAILLVVGVLFALQAIGFDLTLLSVFGGALGVGIGLGLQKLASNYIAGFTILLDRSIRLGDMVTVDGRHGVVSKVTSRYVVVRSLDGVEAIVPNETLVTTTVLNHSYTNRNTRVAVQVQVSYDSDIEAALALMESIARETPRVLAEPGPAAFLASIGDSGANLELGAWINDPEQGQLGLKSTLNRAILKAFAAHDIRLSTPQRNVSIVAVPEGLVPPLAAPQAPA